MVELQLREVGDGGAAGRTAAVVHAAASGARFPQAHQARGFPVCGSIWVPIHSSLHWGSLVEMGAPPSGWLGTMPHCGFVDHTLRSSRRCPHSTAPAAHSSRVPPAAASPCEPQDSAVGFLLQLEGGAKVQAHVYLCYADGQPYRTASGCGGSEEEELFGW